MSATIAPIVSPVEGEDNEAARIREPVNTTRDAQVSSIKLPPPSVPPPIIAEDGIDFNTSAVCPDKSDVSAYPKAER
jgi:hypothetical protein